MTASENFRQVERDLGLIEKLAGEHDEGSPEFDALRRAAFALLYVLEKKVHAEFEEFLKDSKLSADERATLMDRYGIET